MHQAVGPRGSLESARGEALHLEVEALAETGLLAHDRFLRDKPVLEFNLVGMHSPVADRRDGTPLERALS